MNAPIRSAIPARLQQLRQAMQAQGVHAVLVPSADPHLSEYLPEHWQGRQHFSGFTGSMGTLVVRLEGTNVELGKKLLSESGLTILPATGMKEAAQKVVAAAGGKA